MRLAEAKAELSALLEARNVLCSCVHSAHPRIVMNQASRCSQNTGLDAAAAAQLEVDITRVDDQVVFCFNQVQWYAHHTK